MNQVIRTSLNRNIKSALEQMIERMETGKCVVQCSDVASLQRKSVVIKSNQLARSGDVVSSAKQAARWSWAVLQPLAWMMMR